ncbi:DUF4129 domain-containing protein [Chloroflexota bacterium]
MVFNRLINLPWVTIFLSPLAVILLEVLWIYPWLAWAGEWDWLNWSRPLLSLPSLIILVSISFFVTRYFLNRVKSRQWLQLSMMLLTIFLVVRFEYSAGFSLLSGQWFDYTLQLFINSFSHPHAIILAVITSVYMCWRGIRLGQSSLYFNDVYRSFLIGLTGLITLIILWGVSREARSLESLTSSIGLYVVGFFFFSLMALALGNLQAIRRRMLLEEMEPLSNIRWVTILLGVVGGIILLGTGIASIFSSDFVTLLGRLVNFIIGLLGQAVHYLLIPLGYLAEVLVYIVQSIIDLISGGEYQPFQMPAFFEPAVLPETVVTQPLVLNIVLVLKWILFILVTAAIVYLLIKSISRFRSIRAEGEGEVEELSESLWSWQGFTADLRLFLSMLFRKWRRKIMSTVQVKPTPVWDTINNNNMRDIRQIYRQLLWEASVSMIKRQRQETPYEYAGRLSNIIPDASEQLQEITDLYVVSRYGYAKVKDEEIEHAKSLWRFLRKLIRIPGKTRHPE